MAAVEFVASFPQDGPRSRYAIQVGTSGMHVEFEIPESEVGNALDLLAMRGLALLITVKPISEDELRKRMRDYVVGK